MDEQYATPSRSPYVLKSALLTTGALSTGVKQDILVEEIIQLQDELEESRKLNQQLQSKLAICEEEFVKHQNEKSNEVGLLHEAARLLTSLEEDRTSLELKLEEHKQSSDAEISHLKSLYSQLLDELSTVKRSMDHELNSNGLRRNHSVSSLSSAFLLDVDSPTSSPHVDGALTAEDNKMHLERMVELEKELEYELSEKKLSPGGGNCLVASHDSRNALSDLISKLMEAEHTIRSLSEDNAKLTMQLVYAGKYPSGGTSSTAASPAKSYNFHESSLHYQQHHQQQHHQHSQINSARSEETFPPTSLGEHNKKSHSMGKPQQWSETSLFVARTPERYNHYRPGLAPTNTGLSSNRIEAVTELTLPAIVVVGSTGETQKLSPISDSTSSSIGHSSANESVGSSQNCSTNSAAVTSLRNKITDLLDKDSNSPMKRNAATAAVDTIFWNSPLSDVMIHASSSPTSQHKAGSKAQDNSMKLELEISQLQEQLQSWKDRHDALGNELDQERNEVLRLLSLKELNDVELFQASEKCQNSELKVASLEAANEEFCSQIKELRRVITQLNDEKLQQETSLRNVESESSEFVELIKQLEQDLSSKESDGLQLKEMVEKSETELSTVKMQLQHSFQVNETLLAENIRSLEELHIRADTINLLKEENASLIKNYEQCASTCAEVEISAETQLQEINGELIDLRSSVTELKSENDSLHKLLEKTKELLTAERNHSSDLNALVEERKLMLEQKTAKVDVAQSNIALTKSQCSSDLKVLQDAHATELQQNKAHQIELEAKLIDLQLLQTSTCAQLNTMQQQYVEEINGLRNENDLLSKELVKTKELLTAERNHSSDLNALAEERKLLLEQETAKVDVAQSIVELTKSKCSSDLKVLHDAHAAELQQNKAHQIELEAKLVDLQLLQAGTCTKLNTMQQQCDNLNEDIETLNQSNSTLSLEANRKSELFLGVVAKIICLRQQVKEDRPSNSTETAISIEETIREAEINIDEIDREFVKMKESNERISISLNEMKSINVQLAEDLVSCQEAAETLENKITAFGDCEAQLVSDCERLEKEVEHLRLQLKESAARNASLQRDLETIRENTENTSSMEAESFPESHSRELELQVKLAELETRNKSISVELELSRQELRDCKEIHQREVTEDSALTNRLHILEKEVKERMVVTNLAEELAEEASTAKSQYNELLENYNSLQTSKDEQSLLTKENDRLIQEIKLLSEEMRTLNVLIANLENENNILKSSSKKEREAFERKLNILHSKSNEFLTMQSGKNVLVPAVYESSAVDDHEVEPTHLEELIVCKLFNANLSQELDQANLRIHSLTKQLAEEQHRFELEPLGSSFSASVNGGESFSVDEDGNSSAPNSSRSATRSLRSFSNAIQSGFMSLKSPVMGSNNGH